MIKIYTTRFQGSNNMVGVSTMDTIAHHNNDDADDAPDAAADVCSIVSLVEYLNS